MLICELRQQKQLIIIEYYRTINDATDNESIINNNEHNQNSGPINRNITHNKRSDHTTIVILMSHENFYIEKGKQSDATLILPA